MGKNRPFFIFASLLVFTLASNAEAASSRYRQTDPEVSLALTHILPSAFVIPGGTVVLGTTAGLGLFDIADISTNLFLDFSQVYNVSGKISLWSGQDFAAAIFGTYTTQTYKVFDPTTGAILSRSENSIAPGGVISYRIFDNFTGHTGGTFVSSNPSVSKSDLRLRDGFIQGTTVNQEFTIGISSKFAISTGASYDIPYDIAGAGLSLHIGGFQIGAHYFFNVDTDSVLPIIGGGFSTTY